jgi:uncharacterized protein YndB with AHSA1/START domain
MSFPHDQIWARFEVEIDMPRERVWDYLIRPEFRNALMGSDRMEIANRSSGRIAPGSVYQCFHGDKIAPQTILEWQPFERMLVQERPPSMTEVIMLSEYLLESIAGGTRLTNVSAKPTGPLLKRMLIHLLAPVMTPIVKRNFETFKQQIETDYQAHSPTQEEEAQLSGEQIHQAVRESLRGSSQGRQPANRAE